jgi:hypothetical protein
LHLAPSTIECHRRKRNKGKREREREGRRQVTILNNNVGFDKEHRREENVLTFDGESEGQSEGVRERSGDEHA